jgi:uncharacterized protein involved in high-affinity Fe2+ transport
MRYKTSVKKNLNFGHHLNSHGRTDMQDAKLHFGGYPDGDYLPYLTLPYPTLPYPTLP